MSNSSKVKYLLKNVGILTISNFASKIMVFLLVPLYTSVLSTEEYGIYDLVYSSIQFIFPILTMNISDAVMRFLMDKSKDLDNVTAIGFRYVVGSFIPVGLFIMIYKMSHLGLGISGLEVWILVYYVFYVLNQFLIQLAKGFERVFDMGIAGIISTISLLGGIIMLLLVFKLGLKGFFAANLFSQLFPCIYFFFRLKLWNYFKQFDIDHTLKREMLTYSLPLIFSTIGWWINNSLDKYVVAFFCGASANGVFSIAYKLPGILNTFQGIFVNAWQISAIKEYENEKSRDFYGQTFIIINVLMCGIASILILLTKPLAHILFANEFFEAWRYVPILLVACVINSSAGFLGPILSAAKDSKNMAKSAIYGSLINMILNIVLVFYIGVQGATIATVVSSFVIYIVRKKAVGNDIKIRNYPKIIISWILLLILAIFEVNSMSLFYEIFIVAVGILINLNEIISFLKQIKKMFFSKTV